MRKRENVRERESVRELSEVAQLSGCEATKPFSVEKLKLNVAIVSLIFLQLM